MHHCHHKYSYTIKLSMKGRRASFPRVRVNPQQPFTARLRLLPRSPLKPRGCGESIQNPFLQSVHTPTRNPLLGRIAPPLRRLVTSSNLLGPHESRVRRRTSRPELTAAGAMAAEKLRDLSRPIDVPLLDATVAAFYGTGSSDEVTAPP
jgi:hypothetical protein